MCIRDRFNTPSSDQPPRSTSSAVGLSPCKVADLRMKHLEQLRYLQQLMEDRIISESEFLEQKNIITGTLRKIAYTEWQKELFPHLLTDCCNSGVLNPHIV